MQVSSFHFVKLRAVLQRTDASGVCEHFVKLRAVFEDEFLLIRNVPIA